jgi:hypothetical protein
MDIKRYKISIEDLITREGGGFYGSIDKEYVTFKILLTQNINDVGYYSHDNYLTTQVNYDVLIDKLSQSGITFGFFNNPIYVFNYSGFTGDTRIDFSTPQKYFAEGDEIALTSESRLSEVRTIKSNSPYIVGFDVKKEVYYNYKNDLINGVNRVISISGDVIEYVIDANDDSNIGTDQQKGGFRLVKLDDGTTIIRYKSEGWNDTNTDIKAIFKEEYLMNISEEPEVKSDVFIDRGENSVFEYHLSLVDVKSLEHLELFGNGFFNINKT